MDYYKCEKCNKVFDEFEMNYRAAQADKKCLCSACREAENTQEKMCWICGKPKSSHPSPICMSFIPPA